MAGWLALHLHRRPFGPPAHRCYSNSMRDRTSGRAAAVPAVSRFPAAPRRLVDAPVLPGTRWRPRQWRCGCGTRGFHVVLASA